jgi:hypothetical protein
VAQPPVESGATYAAAGSVIDEDSQSPALSVCAEAAVIAALNIS